MSIPQFSLANTAFVDRDGKLTFAASKYLQQIWDRIGGADAWSIDELMKAPQGSIPALDELTKTTDGLGSSPELVALREQVAELIKTDLETQLAQVRELALWGSGMRVRQRVEGDITINGGNSTASYALSTPLLSTTGNVQLSHLGTLAASGSTVADAAVLVEILDTATVRARRSASATATIVTARFALVEYF